jgi:uncharacterized oxidoreductase
MSLIFRKAGLTKAIAAIAAAGGSELAETQLVAENLVMANLTGHDSHGIGMMPRYVEALLEGGLHPNARVEVKLDAGSLLVLDGGAGYGQSIGLQATRMAIERALRHGVSITALGNSHHLGRIGHWAELAIEQGLVSLHFVNVISFARVAAYGGADGRFGTNPSVHRHPAPRRAAVRPRHGDERGRAGEASRRPQQGGEDSAGLAARPRGQSHRRSALGGGAAFRRDADLRRAQGLRPCGGMRAARRALTAGGTWHYPEGTKRRVLNGMLSIVIDPAKLGTGKRSSARRAIISTGFAIAAGARVRSGAHRR